MSDRSNKEMTTYDRPISTCVRLPCELLANCEFPLRESASAILFGPLRKLICYSLNVIGPLRSSYFWKPIGWYGTYDFQKRSGVTALRWNNHPKDSVPSVDGRFIRYDRDFKHRERQRQRQRERTQGKPHGLLRMSDGKICLVLVTAATWNLLNWRRPETWVLSSNFYCIL